MNAFQIFLVLQCCDLATTLVFLRLGGTEANPLLRATMRAAASPALGLLLAKTVGCGLALYAWKRRRTRLLDRANLFFALCVGWNAVAILLL
jgi:hypothetical protein